MEMTLGKRIATLRKEKGIKQEELAQMLDISGQAVSKWENDLTCPDINTLPKLAQILGVTIDELLSGKKESAVVIVPEEQRKNIKDMTLRLVVDESRGNKVRINLPVSMIKMALEMGMELPQFSGNSMAQNINIEQIMELIQQGVVGNLMEVEAEDGTTVKIFVE